MEILNRIIQEENLVIDPKYLKELDNLNTAVARFAHAPTSSHYQRIAGVINTHLVTERSSKTIEEYVERYRKILHPEIVTYMKKHAKQLNQLLERLYPYNYRFYYTGSLSMSSTYSLKDRFDAEPSETPVQIYLRDAIQIHHKYGISDIQRCCMDQARGLYSLATPALVSSGTTKNQTASCYIIDVQDNIESIADKVFRCTAVISSNGGGIGLNLTNIRHSEISTRGMSKGVIPIAKILNRIMLYADQRNTRKGAANLCLAVWHIDIEDFIQLTRKTGQVKKDSTETVVEEPFEMFTTVMTNWLFIHRAANRQDWTLFCPSKVPKLKGLYGRAFIKTYLEYENDPTIPSHAKKVVKASDLANLIFKTRLNTGSPYTIDLDAINSKNPLGDRFYINCSNLCLEVLQYTSEDEIAVCNLASICLPTIIKGKEIDWDLLGYIARELVLNLNRLIDNSMNSVPEANVGAQKRRSLGIGVQGFADFLYLLDLHFEHEKTRLLNKKISACIYWNALAKSVDLAIETGKTYEGFESSHAKDGKLQFDLWRQEYETLKELGMLQEQLRKPEDDEPIHPSEWGQKAITLSNDEVIEPTWESLKAFIQKYGLYNAHVTCQQPTATTSLINNNCEMKEAITENIYTRELMKTEFTIVNTHLERDLRAIGLWDNKIAHHIIFNNGSVSKLESFVEEQGYSNNDPERLKYIITKYKTMFEIKNSVILQLTADSGRYICQSQSTNLYFSEPNVNKIKGGFFLASGLGLKTTSYYTRMKSYTNPSFITEKPKKQYVCTDEICTSCA